MKKPRIPDNEASRLASLRSLDILDTEAEERFDRITRVVKAHFGVAIALVSLVDANRQWFKSSQGIEAKETPRNISFCGHAILSDEIFIINNAVENPDFADNPLVTGPPNIRFYAGAPLHAPAGERIGALCIIDPRPRDLTIEERATLRDLADWAETELAFAKVLAAERESAEADYRGQIEAINRSQMMIEFTMDGTIIKANENYLRPFGYTEADIKGKKHSFFIAEKHCNSKEYKDFWDELRAGKFKSGEFLRIGKNGREVWLEASYNPIPGPDGIPVKVVKFAADVTEKVEARCKFRDAEARLRAVFDNVMDGIITIDSKGSIVSVNRAFLRIFEYDEPEVIGQNVKILMPEPNRSNHEAYMARYQSKTGSNIIGVGRELEGLTREGRSFPIELTVTEVTLHGNRFFVGLIRDITERKKAEEKLRNAYQLISNDLESAAAIQKNLLPEASTLEGVRFEWLFCPSSFVAGDIFNYFQIGEGQVGFYLLDVSGHGVPAAMLSVSLSWMFSNMLQNEGDDKKITRRHMMSPAKIIGKLNTVFQENRTAGQYITMIYGVLDCSMNRLTISQAGLPAPIHCNSSGASSVIGSGGFPVGLVPDVDYEEETIDFYPGDRLFLYSDGITECFNAESIQFSDERLVGLIEDGSGKQLDNLLRSIEYELRLWRGDKQYDDDVTLLAIERR
jgi:PAS domain S-box-containing protein